MKKKYLFVLIFSALIFSACKKDGAANSTDENSVQKFSLKNGIELYYKKVDSTRINAMGILISGGSALLPREMSGLESATLELMSRTSEKYSYSDMQALSYDKHIGVSHSTSYCGSTFSVSALDYYFDQALEVLLDCFFNPTFDEEQFSRMRTEYEQGNQETLNDPEDFLNYTMLKEIYSGHPLGTSSGVLPESIENITIENIRAHYQKLLDARRIRIVAAGNINVKKLIRRLEKSFCALPASDEDFKIPELPPLKIQGGDILLHSASLQGSGHIMRIFNAPPIDSPDYIACRIMTEMYDEVLFNLVRTKYGVCYTPQCGSSFSTAPFGYDFLYRVSDFENAAPRLSEASDLFAAGKMLSSFGDVRTQDDAAAVNATASGENLSYEYDSIEERLPAFIKKYVNSAYQNQKSCAAILSRISSSLLYFGEPEKFDALVQDAKNVTAADISRVFEKYWRNGDYRYFAICGNGEEMKLR